MPLYEYACSHCGHEFEQLTPMRNRDKSIACPSCGRMGASRKLSMFSAGSSRSSDAGSPPSCERCGMGPCPMGDFRS